MHMINFNDIWEQTLFPLLIVRGWKYHRGAENIVLLGEDIVGVKISSHTGTVVCPFITGRGIGAETCGIDNVFPADDL